MYDYTTVHFSRGLLCVHNLPLLMVLLSVLSGVPQDTVLAPLMFLLYILNEIANGFHPPFADDCILYWVIKAENASIILQHDLS